MVAGKVPPSETEHSIKTALSKSERFLVVDQFQIDANQCAPPTRACHRCKILYLSSQKAVLSIHGLGRKKILPVIPFDTYAMATLTPATTIPSHFIDKVRKNESRLHLFLQNIVRPIHTLVLGHSFRRMMIARNTLIHLRRESFENIA